VHKRRFNKRIQVCLVKYYFLSHNAIVISLLRKVQIKVLKKLELHKHLNKRNLGAAHSIILYIKKNM